MAVRSKAWVCISSLAGIVGSNPTGAGEESVERLVCFQVELGLGPLEAVAPWGKMNACDGLQA